MAITIFIYNVLFLKTRDSLNTGIQEPFANIFTKWGSGCGSVGRAVASNTRGPRFESSHWQKFIYIEHLFTVNCIEKTKIKEKRPGMAHLKKHIHESAKSVKCDSLNDLWVHLLHLKTLL